MENSKAWEEVNGSFLFEYWFVIILVHIFGNVLSSTRWCIESNNKSSGNCGLAMYYIGSAITKLSYGFAPIALLLPLQSVVIVFNALFKSKHNYNINKVQVIGMMIILVSLTITMIFGPRSNSSYYTIDDLLFKLNESSSIFIILLLSLFVLINWLIFSIQCKYKTDEFYLLTFVHISAYFGGCNIVFTKCILELISSSLISIELALMNWTHWLSYVVVIAFILSFIAAQNWKQKAYDKYGTKNVHEQQQLIAIDTFLLIMIGIIFGSMLFDEFSDMILIYLIIYFIAILISFVGVGIVSFTNYHNVDDTKHHHLYNESQSMHSIEVVTQCNNEKQLNWQIIGQILMDHAFIDTVEATNVTLDQLEDFFEEEDIESADEFRDALCASYCSVNDEGSILWQVLFLTLNYGAARRQRFYNLVLHEYFALSDMSVANLVQILSKMTRDLNVDVVEFGKIKEIVLNKKIDGHKFLLMNCSQFQLLFRWIRSVDESLWSLIYEELMYWNFQQFQEKDEIDWESIGCVLWNNNFCDDQHELNACLDELEVYFVQENLGPDVLRQEVCISYGNKSDKGTVLRKILFSIMKYSKKKRLQFYDILLHKFMELETLNTTDLINVLKRSAHQVDKRINLKEFESIAALHKLNGAHLAAIRRSEHFADIFHSIRSVDSTVWERLYQHEMMKWQKYTPTEYEFSVSRLKTTQNIKYVEIPNEEEQDEGSEIANALIDILEDVALSNEPYVPSKRVLSEESRSRSRSNKMKRRRPSTANKVFPRERRSRTHSKDSSASNRIDLHHVDKYLKYVICAGHHFKENRALLSYLIDSYDLTRFAAIDTLAEFNLSTFLMRYRYFTQVEDYIVHKYDLQDECHKTGDFMSKTFDEYCILFGHEISFSPCIKIIDSMGAFMSYAFSMSNAIKIYMSPSPQMCPLIVDLWIIPNKTGTLNDNTTIINSIGDIKQRLQSNKLRYIKKCCSSSDIVQTTYNIQECLCSANIRHGLKHKAVNRIVFIIDRRYQHSDYLYCFIPPTKYAKVSDDESTFHINHTNHTSRYLLPSTSPNNNDSIGASDNCNGYMFALSFVLYRNRRSRRSKKRNSFYTKIYFYSQGGKVRFLPKQIATLWPKYFAAHDTKKYDTAKLIKTLFHLNLEDPYFAKHSELHKEFVTEIEEEDKEECIEQLREWALFNKTLCQNNDNLHLLASIASTETTPTAEVAALSNRIDVFAQPQINKQDIETVIL